MNGSFFPFSMVDNMADNPVGDASHVSIIGSFESQWASTSFEHMISLIFWNEVSH